MSQIQKLVDSTSAPGDAPLSKYVVDADGTADYVTIQAALDAANAVGVDATISVRPGTYTESLTLYDGLQVVGATGFSDADTGVEIVGIHTPPLTGGFVFRNIKLTSATHIFNSAGAGSSHLIVADCAVEVTNGYLFNLVNWTGIFEMWDVNSGFGTNDGCVNNTGGATVLAFSGSGGIGTGNDMIVSGEFFTDSFEFACPIDFQTGSILGIERASFTQTVTLSNNSTGSFTSCIFDTGVNQAITHNSANTISLSDVSVDTSNATAIGGTGTIDVGSITFIDSDVIAGTITQNLAPPRLHTGEIIAENITNLSFSGRNEWTGAGVYYSVAGTTFTLERGGTGYIKGRKLTWTGAQNTGALAAGSTYYVYVDSTGTIGSTATRTTTLFIDNVVLFEILVDASSNTIVVREDHPYTFPVNTSEWAHETIGVVIANKNNGANITLNGTKAIQIDGADELEDHGLEVDIPDSAAAAVNFSFMYTNGAGKWVRGSIANTFPSEYNNAGTVTALGASKYGIFRLYVSKDDLNSSTPTYYAVYDDQEYNNLTAANTAIALDNPSTISNELAQLELAQLGLVVKEQSSDTIVNVVIEKSTARSTVSSSTGGTAALTSTDTTNFNGWLSAADTTVQAALETLDDIGLKSAFLAYMNAQDLNVTGNGTAYTIINWDVEVFDQNADFNPVTGVFTAPVTGKYRFAANIVMSNLTSSNSILNFVTSNRTYSTGYLNPGVIRNSGLFATHAASTLADMDLGDTCYLVLTNTGAGADNEGLYGDGTNVNTFFTGQLEV